MIKPVSNRSLISRNSHQSSCMNYLFDFIKIMDLNNIRCMLEAVHDNNLHNIDQSTMLKLFDYTNYMQDALMNLNGRLGTKILIIDSDAT